MPYYATHFVNILFVQYIQEIGRAGRDNGAAK